MECGIMEKTPSVYEKLAKNVIRVLHYEFDFNKRTYPHWYPITKDTRLCCHYHVHEMLEFIMVEEGEVIFQTSGRSSELKKGDILLINPFEPHSAFIPNECDRTVYYVINIDIDSLKNIPSASLRSILDDISNGRSVYRIENYDDEIREKLVTCFKGITENIGAKNEIMQLGYVFHFFALLGQPSYIDDAKENKRSTEFIKTTVLYIQTTPPQDISLDAIAKLLSYNKAYFTTIFKKNFGMSFIDYVNNYKIEKAREYIRKGNYNLNDVAMKSGFNYYAYFFKKFKAITGISPSDFVEHCRANN